MASLLISAAGAAIGGYFFPGVVAFNLTGSQIGYFAGGLLANSLLGGSGPDIEGARLSDLKVQVSTYGNFIPITYGTTRLSGNIIWASDLVETKKTEDAGGKGGGGQEYTTYSYAANFAIKLCKGEIAGVRRIWANGNLILDKSDTNEGYSGLTGNIRVYVGNEMQEPDSLIQAYLGAGNVPAYRGDAYVVFENLQLEKYGNRIPNLSFEVVKVGQEALRDVVNVPQAASNNLSIGRGRLIGNQIWGFQAINGSGTDYNRLGLLTVDTGAFQILFEESGDNTLNEYHNILYISTVYVNGLPFELNRIWVAAGTNTLYSHEGTRGQRTDSTVNQLGGRRHQLEFCDYLQQVMSIPSLTSGADEGSFIEFWKPFLYDEQTMAFSPAMLFSASVSAVGLGNNQLIHHKNSKYLVCLNNTAVGVKVYDLDSLLLVLEFDLNNFTLAHAYDSLRDIFYIITDSTGSNQRITKIDSALNVTTEDRELIAGVSSQAKSLLYVDALDKFLYESSLSGIYFAVLNGEDLAEEYYNFSATSYNEPSLYDYPNLRDLGNGYALSGSDDGISFIPYTTRLTREGVTLSSIVADICSQVDLSPADIDVSQLTDIVKGYAITQVATARQSIETLQSAYFFDGVESS